MTRRYFVPNLPAEGGAVTLPDAESQHAIRVMRIKPGQIVTLFDGRGHETDAEVTAVDKRHCVCTAAASRPVDRESGRPVQMAIALPKPERARELVERLTELGVRSITPLIAQRCQRAPSAGQLEKLARVVVEASKQCGRNVLMRIEPPQRTEAFFAERLRAERDGGAEAAWECWIADPNGLPLVAKSLPTHGLSVAIGPEGGWTDQELAWADRADFTRVSLGKRILRIETAAALVAARCCD